MNLEQQKAIALAQARRRRAEAEAAPQPDSLLENTGDVAGELAAAGNRSLMYIPDTAVEALNTTLGGYKGLVEMLRTGDINSAVTASRSVDIPNVSDLVEMASGQRPGQGGYMEPGMAREAVEAFGEVAVPGAAGMVPVKRGARFIDDMAEFAGFGTKSVPLAGADAADVIARSQDAYQPPQLPAVSDKGLRSAKRENALLSNTSNPARVPYRLNEVGRPVKDQAQRSTQKSGVSDDLIALVASANPTERRQMLRMVDAVAEGDPVIRAQNTPRMALADSMTGRVDNLLSANRQAAQAQRKAINDLRSVRLKPEQVQALSDGPMGNLQQSLTDLNVTFDPTKGVLDFGGSVFETSPEAQGKIRTALNYLYNNSPRTAHDLHIAKDAINELVEWGADKAGAGSKAISLMKGIRHDLSDFLRNMPEASDYAMANEQLSETIPVIDEINRLLGKSVDIRSAQAGPGVARLSRRILSNAQSSEAVDSVLQQLAKYGGEDDVWRQNVFLDELDRAFGTQQRRSLQGEQSKATEEMLKAIQENKGVTARVVDYAGKVFTKTPDEQRRAQLSALRKLITDSLSGT